MKPAGKWLAAGLLLGAIVIGISLIQSPKNTEPPAASGSEPQVRKRSSSPDLEAERETSDMLAQRSLEAQWEDLLRWMETPPPPTPEEIRKRLLETRLAWTEMDSQVLAKALDTMLKSGRDLKTGLDFKVGPHGFLAGWPTLRVFLLDILAASDPEMAAAIARGILDKTPSANEYATALRSLIRPGRARAADEELVSRLAVMLETRDWHGERGFAEAMDLVRFIGSDVAAARLMAWQGNPGLKSMAMHEFAAEHPEKIIGLLTDTQTIESPVRADLMARADPADPAQLAAVDQYLRKPDLTTEEVAAFLKAFPLRSVTTGYRLYGKTPAPYSRDHIATGDKAALEIVRQWANDPSLQNHRPQIDALQKRLEAWTQAAGKE
jgi:hypothetical protein